MKRVLISLCLLALVMGALSPAASAEVRRYALIVGVNRADSPDLRPLQYADDDAVRHFELFERYARKAVLLSLLDPETQSRFRPVVPKALPPSVANFKKALNELFGLMRADNAAGIETEFFLVYSGHGRILPGREGAVTLADGMLTRTALYEQVLKASPAGFNHLIIDACNAYFLVHGKGSGGWQPDRTGQQRGVEVQGFFEQQDLSRYPNTGVILSTSSEAESHEWELYRGGIFSHEIRSGLLGGADVDENGLVTYNELHAFVTAANQKVDDPKARLQVFVAAPARDLGRPLVDLDLLAEGMGALEIPKGLPGRFYVENEHGMRYADLNKNDEQGVRLLLTVPPRIYYLRDEAGDAPRQFRVSARKGEVTRLDERKSEPIKVASRGSVEESFRKYLFAQPFGANYYAGLMASRTQTNPNAPGMAPAAAVRSVPDLKPAPPGVLRPRLGTVAVFKIRPDRVDEGMARTLSDVVLNEIEGLQLFDEVYSHNEMIMAIQREEDRQKLTSCTDTSCMVEIAAPFNAAMVVAGSVGKLGATHVLTLSLINAQTQKSIGRQMENIGGAEDGLLIAARAAVQRLFGEVAGVGYLDGARLAPGTRVKVGEHVEAIAPLRHPITVKAGTYAVALLHPTVPEQTINGEVTAGHVFGLANIPEPLSPPPPPIIDDPVAGSDVNGDDTKDWRLAVAWASVGVGTAAVVSGTVLMVLAQLAFDDCCREKPAGQWDNDLLDKGTKMWWASIGLYSASAVFAGLATYSFLTMEKPDGKPVQAVYPLFGPGPDGRMMAGVGGTW